MYIWLVRRPGRSSSPESKDEIEKDGQDSKQHDEENRDETHNREHIVQIRLCLTYTDRGMGHRKRVGGKRAVGTCQRSHTRTTPEKQKRKSSESDRSLCQKKLTLFSIV